MDRGVLLTQGHGLKSTKRPGLKFNSDVLHICATQTTVPYAHPFSNNANQTKHFGVLSSEKYLMYGNASFEG